MKKLLKRNQAKKVWNDLLPIDKHPYNTFENFFKSNDWKATKKRKQKPKKVNFISTNLKMKQNQAKRVWNNFLPIDKHPYNTFEKFFKSNDWEATKKKAKIRNGTPVMSVDDTHSPGSYSVKQPGYIDRVEKTKTSKSKNINLKEEKQYREQRREEELRREDEEQIRREQRREEKEQIRREQRREEELRREEEEQIRREQRREEELRRKDNEQTSSNNFSTSTSTSSKSSEPRGTFDKFADGDLDLATAFWAFGVFGSIIVGVVCGVLAEMVHKFFNFPYVMITLFIIVSLGQCAENHKKVMTQQKKSVVWGVLTQVYCVLGILGLIRFIFDIFGK